MFGPYIPMHIRRFTFGKRSDILLVLWLEAEVLRHVLCDVVFPRLSVHEQEAQKKSFADLCRRIACLQDEMRYAREIEPYSKQLDSLRAGRSLGLGCTD